MQISPQRRFDSRFSCGRFTEELMLKCGPMFLAVALILGGSASASAGWINELGRNLGLGWSDGCHAYEGCPDPRLRSQPWQRRSTRSLMDDHYAAPCLAPAEKAAPSLEHLPSPAPSSAPENLAPPKTSRAPTPGAIDGRLHISRPAY